MSKGMHLSQCTVKLPVIRHPWDLLINQRRSEREIKCKFLSHTVILFIIYLFFFFAVVCHYPLKCR